VFFVFLVNPYNTYNTHKTYKTRKKCKIEKNPISCCWKHEVADSRRTCAHSGRSLQGVGTRPENYRQRHQLRKAQSLLCESWQAKTKIYRAARRPAGLLEVVPVHAQRQKSRTDRKNRSARGRFNYKHEHELRF